MKAMTNQELQEAISVIFRYLVQYKEVLEAGHITGILPHEEIHNALKAMLSIQSARAKMVEINEGIPSVEARKPYEGIPDNYFVKMMTEK